MRAVKLRAVNENRKLKDMIADLLRRGLAQGADVPGAIRARVRLPLVQCAQGARPDEEMTPDRVAEILMEETNDAAFKQFPGRDVLLLR